MNAFLLIFGAVVLAVGVAAGRYFAGGKGWKWVNTTDDKDRYDEKAVLRFLSKCMYALGGCFGGGFLLGGLLGITVMCLVQINRVRKEERHESQEY